MHNSTFQMVFSVVLLGIGVLASYYFLLPHVKPNEPLSALWFGIPKSIQHVYYVSIVLSGIAFIASFVWIVQHIVRDDFIQHLTTAYIVFLIGAISWSVTLWWWGTTQKKTIAYTLSQASVVLSLTVTTIGVAWLLYNLWHIHQSSVRIPMWCFACVIYLLFHVFVLDNIRWVFGFLTV